MTDFKIYQNGSKDGRYYIAEDTHEQNLSYAELYHYGVKGMKWGVRRTPEQLGHKMISKSNKKTSYTKSIRTLIDSLSKTQRYYIGDGYWIDKDRTVYRNVIGDEKHVDAFLDVYNLPHEHHGEGTVVLAVSNEKSGQGYATKLAKKLVNDYENGKFGKDLSNLIWRVDEGNGASDAVAKKAGFIYEGIEEEFGEKLNVYRYYKDKAKHSDYSNSLTHYGIKGMKWGVRKDLAKAHLSKSFNDARYSKPVQTVANTTAGKAAKKALYTTFDVKNFDDLVVKVGKMAKSPKGIAAIGAIVVLPDPLIWAGMAAYASVKNSGVLNRHLKHEDVSMNELKHYGILGMKWGVRRTPEQLGHVKKGTKMYRVTPNPNEKEEGSTYVTYLRPDRDMYRGAFNKQGGFQQYYNLDPKDPLYESVYKLKDDLNVATYNIQKKVTNEILKKNNEEMLKNLCKNVAEERLSDFEKRVEAVEQYRKANPEAKLPTKEKLREIWLRGAKNGKAYTKIVLKDFRDMQADELYRAVSSMFGTEQLIKESVISELKKRGYNAMIDQASVGGGSELNKIEGQAPMIIFDRGESLDKIGSKKISKWTMNNSTANYMDWYRKVNSDDEKIKNWANPKTLKGGK